MSNKTFLQELQVIKTKVESLREKKWNSNECNCVEIDKELEEVGYDLKAMIDQCLEIQLAMMKQGTMPHVKG